MKNYIKVVSSNGGGLDTHGTFFFDDRDQVSTAGAVAQASACIADVNRTKRKNIHGEPERPASAAVWTHVEGVPFPAIGES